MLFGSNAKVINNTFHNNEFSIYLSGENNKVAGNETSSDTASSFPINFMAYGALISGTNNHFAGNTFRAKEGTGAIGYYILAYDSKVTGNRISGFPTPVYDSESDNKIKGTPAPPAGI